MIKTSFKNNIVFFFSTVFLLIFFNYANYEGYVNVDKDRVVSMEIFGPGLILLIFNFIKINNLKFYFFKKFMPIIYLFIFVLFVISFFRTPISESFRNSFSILITYSFVIGLSIILHQLDLILVLKIFIYLICLIILPFNLFIQYTKQGGFAFFPDRLGGEDTLRFGGALYHAHNGMILGFALLLIIYFLFVLKVKSYILSFLLVALPILIILTDCRSVWGGVVVSIFLMLYTRYKSRFVIISILLGSVFLIGNFNLKPKNSQLNETGSDTSFRGLIWLSGIKGIVEQPITGYGNTNYFQTNFKSRIEIGEELNDPHNSFLNLFLMFGIPASLILIVIYIKIFKHFLNSRSRLELFVIMFYWLFVPFFWGHIYSGYTGFIQFFFPLTIFSIYLHPGLWRCNYVLKKINSVSVK